jgi:hypothetical protein
LAGDLAEELHAGKPWSWFPVQIFPAIVLGITTQTRACFQRSDSMTTGGEFVMRVGRTLLLLVATWMLGFASVRIGEMVGGWPATAIGELVAFGVGTLLAVVFRARFAAYLCAAMVAYAASELVVHAIYGIRAAQGAATHFAVMGSGMIAVILGAVVTKVGQVRTRPLPLVTSQTPAVTPIVTR